MSISRQQFVEQLSSSGVLSAEELAALGDQLSSGDAAEDAQTLANTLVQSGTLSEYQAAAICDGRADTLVFGEHIVLDRIGAGGMGEVFKARHRTMQRDVAIKVLPEQQTAAPNAVERFHQEVRAAAKLKHENIVIAYDAGNKGDLHYLIMEYVEGRDLADIVDNDGPLPVEQAMDVTLQTARGLDCAHKRGIVHRDIKPANLLLTSPEDAEADASSDAATANSASRSPGSAVVKILDMGLARVTGGAGDHEDEQGLTRSDQVMGTGDYISPEQARNTSKADARSDVYSLGCTLYRLLTGKTPFTGESFIDKVFAHAEKPIPPLGEACPDIPQPLEDLYQRMLAKEPADRPQTMAEVVAALEAIIRGDSAPDARLVDFLDNIGHKSGGPAAAGSRGPKASAAKTAAPVKEKTAPVTEETIDYTRQDDTSRTADSKSTPTTGPPPTPATAATSPAPTAKPISAPRRRRASARRRQQALPLLMIGIGVGISLIGAAIVAVVVYVQTNYGTIIVDARDENIRVSVQRGGSEIYVVDARNQWRIEAKAGEYHVEIKGGHDRLTLDKDTVTVTRGGELRVRVELKPQQIVRGKTPPKFAIAPFDEDEAREHQRAWADALGLPVKRQVDLPGGRQVIATSRDGTLRLWKVAQRTVSK